MKRKLALLLALVMVLSLVPMSAFAASNTKTIVVNTPSIADDYKSVDESANSFTRASTLVIERDAFDVADGAAFKLVLPSGVKWSGTSGANTAYTVGGAVYNDAKSPAAQGFSILGRTDQVLDLAVAGGFLTGSGKQIRIPLFIDLDGATGPIQVTVDGIDSGISGGTFTIANVAKGATVATIESVKMFTETETLSTIRIEETSIKSMGTATTVKLRLPNGFTWANTPNITGIGGLSGVSFAPTSSAGTRDLEYNLTSLPANRTARGSLLITGAQVKAASSAAKGEVEITVSGSEITTQDLVIAKYDEYSILVKADGEPRELISGRRTNGFDSNDHKLQKLVIKEEIANSILNRRTRVEFPSWVKVVGVEVTKATNVTGGAQQVRTSIGNYTNPVTDTRMFASDKREDNFIEFTIQSASSTVKTELELVFYVSVKANEEGDITAVVSGRSGIEGEVVLGQARRPVEVSAGKPTDLIIGRKGQEIADITISEIKAEDIMDGILTVKLPADLSWSAKPTVTVVAGDLKIDATKVTTDESNLNIALATGDLSRKASTIEITNAKVDVNRLVPEGTVNAGIRNTAVRLNHNANQLNQGYFDQNNVASVQVATVVTPAQGQQGKFEDGTREPFELKIGQIPEGGDTAPYVKNNRSFAPVSAVAQALGVAKSNIIWNAEARTVTILGDKTVQMTIGSTTLLVNGTPVAMDVAPEITNNRTFLPIAWLAKALDVQYTWDAATQTVSFY